MISRAIKSMSEGPRHWLQVTAIVVGIAMIFCGQADATTVTAKSVSLADVGSAVGSAREGDTVMVPAGTASWTSTLTITKGITIEGAGNDKTVILDDLPREERGEQSRQWGQERGEQQRQRGQERGAQQRERGQLERPNQQPSERSRDAFST